MLVTPREEEPQIDVTFADIFIPFPGASASEIEHLVAGPAEQVLSEIQGIEHVYSVSRPGMAVVTVQFKVGEDNTDAVVRLFSKVQVKPGLAAAQSRRRYAHRQAQGHRRRAHPHRNPLVQG